VETKKCKKCGEVKPISDFYTDKGKVMARCKKCKNEEHQLWVKNNPNRPRELTKEWHMKNPEWGKRNNKEWREKNKDKQKEYIKKWLSNHPGKIAEYSRRRTKLIKNSPRDNLRKQISCLIAYSLKHNGSKRGRKWELLVGYTVEQLKVHIERNFLAGMSWENRNEWHIDHIIPVSAFNFEAPEDVDFKKCWSLKNLRPLWAKDNIEKGNKLEKPYQPSLLL
jgi:hypothetical protein